MKYTPTTVEGVTIVDLEPRGDDRGFFARTFDTTEFEAHGLDWRPLLPASDFADAPASPKWFAFGAGERRVYLDTPTWGDLTPATVWAALTGGDQILHVERTLEPGRDLHALRLRPEEYRRLWAAVRAEFDGPPRRIDHPGYGLDDAFYEGRGKATALHTCNNWVADKLRLAGVETSLWSPFAQGLMWRYREPERQPG